MEARTVPRAAPAGVSGIPSPRLLRVASDAHLVAWVREGRAVAFEAVYDRHHRAILSFCRHMLGSVEEAEDAVQHTFLAAYNDLTSSNKPIQLRAWLFTIARNRCYSILRARREQPMSDLDEPTTEGLATQVQRRQDLRDLVGDLRRLPDDQRAALVLSEMDALSHEQIGDVLGVPKDKVKALVFQARESLVASRAARETDCAEIREQLANLRGGALRRANLRRHLRECAGCREFRLQIDRQRRQLKVLIPVAPTFALKEAVLATTIGGSTGAVAGSGLVAGSLLKTGAVKSMIGALVAGVGTAGTIVAVRDFQNATEQPFSNLHQLTMQAPFTPAPPTNSAHSSRASAPDYSATPNSASAATGAGATSSGVTGAAATSTVSRSTSSDTMRAILHPLSRDGLSFISFGNPLVKTAPPGLSRRSHSSRPYRHSGSGQGSGSGHHARSVFGWSGSSAAGSGSSSNPGSSAYTPGGSWGGGQTSGGDRGHQGNGGGSGSDSGSWSGSRGSRSGSSQGSGGGSGSQGSSGWTGSSRGAGSGGGHRGSGSAGDGSQGGGYQGGGSGSSGSGSQWSGGSGSGSGSGDGSQWGGGSGSSGGGQGDGNGNGNGHGGGGGSDNGQHGR